MALGVALAAGPQVASAAFPGRNGRISYIENDRGRVVSVRAGGGHDRVLASLPTGVGSSAYSPDGRQILFGPLAGQSGALYLKRASGRGQARRLTRPFDPPGARGGDQQADWAPDGRSVVFLRDYGAFSVGAPRPKTGPCAAALYCIRIYHRGRTRALVSARGLDFPSVEPVWSVRGWIAFVQNGDIWIIRPDGSGKRRVINTDDIDGSLDWSPDGRRLIFANERGQLITVGADGRHLHRLGRLGEAPAYSPDGKLIVAQPRPAVGDHALTTIDLRRGTKRLVRTRYPAAFATDWQPLP